MADMKKIVESVPNFSEGRDPEKIEMIANSFRGKAGVKLLDYQSDPDHNRLVVTVVGEPGPLKICLTEAVGVAVETIDMRKHEGQHPRMGAVDVIPLIPIRNVSLAETIALSKDVAATISEKYKLPVFLYEKSALQPERRQLSDIRKGQFEGMTAKIKLPEWKPDFGPHEIHPTAGATAVGVRMPLVAFNVNLGTGDIAVANAVAKKVRHVSEGLGYCKAVGIALKKRGIVQVSMNMTDYTKTALHRAFERIKFEAGSYGVSVVGSEIVGLVPMQAMIDSAVHYMGIDNFSMEQVLEARIMD